MGLAGDSVPRQHGGTIGNREDLVEILADHQHGGAPRARSRSSCLILAAEVASTPAVGWWTTGTPGLRSISRPMTNFWRLPARGRSLGVALALLDAEHLAGPAHDPAGGLVIDDAAAHAMPEYSG